MASYPDSTAGAMAGNVDNRDTSATNPSSQSTEKFTKPIVTLAMRKVALKKLAEGHPPSFIGTVLPSLHPDYFCSLFLGPMSNVDLFLDSGDSNGNDPDSAFQNAAVIYLDEWRIENLVTQAMTRPLNISLDGLKLEQTDKNQNTDLSTKIEAVRHIQRNNLSLLSGLAKEVRDWKLWDSAQQVREHDALEVILDDPLAEQPGALENLVQYWRDLFDWSPGKISEWHSSTTLDTASRPIRLTAYGPIFCSSVESLTFLLSTDVDDLVKVKYTFSQSSGLWKTSDKLNHENEKLLRDRNNWLIFSIGQIERRAWNGLIQQGCGSVLQLIDSSANHIYDHGHVDDGGQEHTGQNAATNTRVKKRMPERMPGSVKFVPEDGSLTGFDLLIDAAKDIEEPSNEDGADDAGHPTPQSQPPGKGRGIIDSNQHQSTYHQANTLAGYAANFNNAAYKANAAKTKQGVKIENEHDVSSKAASVISPLPQGLLLSPFKPESQPSSRGRKATNKIDAAAESQSPVTPVRKSSRVAKRKMRDIGGDSVENFTTTALKKEGTSPTSASPANNEATDTTLDEAQLTSSSSELTPTDLKTSSTASPEDSETPTRTRV